MEAFHRTTALEGVGRLIDSHRDNLYSYDAASQKQQNEAKPWKSDPHYFKQVRISAVALVKMVMHARSGGSLEVMGLMQGSIQGDAFIVMDAFRLPVEGTETRVNAQDDANEYMVSYTQRSRDSGQPDNIVGWYHSHPGYGCWLSGIDVNTQHTQQSFQDPFLAVVIDPDRTISAGKVEIGAFRTYPENYTPEDQTDNDGFQSIPLAKAEDFGAYSNRYYALEVSHFKSSFDNKLLEILWNKYWVGTLSSNPLLANRDYSTKQIQDLAEKIRQAEKTQADSAKRAQGPGGLGGRVISGKDDQMDRILRASDKVVAEEEAGLLAGDIKERLFTGLVDHDNDTQ